jgi:hypothetical protein
MAKCYDIIMLCNLQRSEKMDLSNSIFFCISLQSLESSWHNENFHQSQVETGLIC